MTVFRKQAVGSLRRGPGRMRIHKMPKVPRRKPNTTKLPKLCCFRCALPPNEAAVKVLKIRFISRCSDPAMIRGVSRDLVAVCLTASFISSDCR